MFFKSFRSLSPKTQRYSALFFLLISAFLCYIAHSIGFFLGQHVMPESLTGFSVINPNFEYWNLLFTLLIGLGSTVGLLSYIPFREYLFDAADELTRISWVKNHELQTMIGVVLMTILLSSIVLFLMDSILGQIARKLIASATK